MASGLPASRPRQNRHALPPTQRRRRFSIQTKFAMNNSFRLRAGDVIRFEGQPCRVVRVNDCASVVAVAKQPREFTTLFGVGVRIQPKAALVRISPDSEIEILNH